MPPVSKNCERICESEALWVQWEDLDLDGGFLWVASGRHDHRTKSGKGRWVPLTARLVWGLRKHASSYRTRICGGKRSPWVFYHEIRRRHAKAGERKSASHVKEVVGHADLRTTMGYTHLSREHLRSLVEEPAEMTKRVG